MKLLYLSFLLLICSCSKKQENLVNYNNFTNSAKDSLTFVMSDSINFELDSLTIPFNNSVSCFTDKYNKSFFSLLNQDNNSIYIYNVNNGRQISKISFEKEGVNGVGNLYGHILKNLDSIYVYNPNKDKLFLSNLKGEIVDTYGLHNESTPSYNGGYSKVNINTLTSALITDSLMYFTAYNSGEKKGLKESDRPVDGIYYIKSRNYQSGSVTYPKCYENTNWGGEYFREIYSTFDDVENQIFSFPASHNITIKNLNSKKNKEYYMGSKYIKAISSFNFPIGYYDEEKIIKHYLENPAYTAIVYDRYNQLYYRFAERGKDMKGYNKYAINHGVKEFSVIIMNKEFRIVGEVLIPKFKYSPRCYFISSKGLYLKKINQNEDILSFGIFKIKEI